MPELPDLELYLKSLDRFFSGQELEDVVLLRPFFLRSVGAPPSRAVGRRLVGLSRLGKRVVFELEDELFFVVHLMIAGRFRVGARNARAPGKIGLLQLDFATGRLWVTEAGTKKRASLHVVEGRANLAAHDPGGIEPLECDARAFTSALRRRNHTLKRALCDPTLFAGIGNSYSDEILHRARLSPFKRSADLTEEEAKTLYRSARTVLSEWSARLERETGDRFPVKVTAFRDGMAVHGRHRKPCPTCGTSVQRVVYAETEFHYCPTCQTGGKLLADRALSRLLGRDWPKTVEELELRLDDRRSR